MSRDYDDDDDIDDRDDDRERDADDRGFGRGRGDDEAMARTNLPGVFLIIVGVFNLLGALYFVANTAFVASQTPEQMAKQNEDMMKMLGGAQGQAPPVYPKPLMIGVNVGLLLATLLGGILPILGGAKMRSLNSYGLSVSGAVFAMIPCVSVSACPCAFGLAIGLWALIVLVSPEVKSAFR
jgi:hypothetical protein